MFVSDFAHMGLFNRISVCVDICLFLSAYFWRSFVLGAVVKFLHVYQERIVDFSTKSNISMIFT